MWLTKPGSLSDFLEEQNIWLKRRVNELEQELKDAKLISIKRPEGFQVEKATKNEVRELHRRIGNPSND